MIKDDIKKIDRYITSQCLGNDCCDCKFSYNNVCKKVLELYDKYFNESAEKN